MKCKKILTVIMCIILLFVSVISAAAVTSENGIRYQTFENTSMLEICGLSPNGELIGATEIVLPSTINGQLVVSIANAAFYSNTALQHITLPSELNTIADYAFYQATNLINITFPDNLRKIGRNSFAYCTALQNVTFDTQKLELLDKYTFAYCSSLDNVILPNNLSMIDDYAFIGCSSLQKIYIPASVSSIADTAFYQCPNLTIFGVADSQADYYARSNNIPFVTLTSNNTEQLNYWISVAQYSIQNSQSLYTTETFENLITNYNHAVAVQQDFFATQTDIDTACQSLSQAYYALQPVNLAELNEKKTIAQNCLQSSYRYKSSSLPALNDALQFAQTQLDKPFLTYDYAQLAIQKLDDAMAQLENVLVGDVNSDDKLTLSDAVILQRYVVGILSADDEASLYRADFDGNGNITVRDVILLQRYMLNQ